MKSVHNKKGQPPRAKPLSRYPSTLRWRTDGTSLESSRSATRTSLGSCCGDVQNQFAPHLHLASVSAEELASRKIWDAEDDSGAKDGVSGVACCIKATSTPAWNRSTRPKPGSQPLLRANGFAGPGIIGDHRALPITLRPGPPCPQIPCKMRTLTDPLNP